MFFLPERELLSDATENTIFHLKLNFLPTSFSPSSLIVGVGVFGHSHIAHSLFLFTPLSIFNSHPSFQFYLLDRTIGPFIIIRMLLCVLLFSSQSVFKEALQCLSRIFCNASLKAVHLQGDISCSYFSFPTSEMQKYHL